MIYQQQKNNQKFYRYFPLLKDITNKEINMYNHIIQIKNNKP